MDSNIFSALEQDAIGEILNISLGASATAVSTMLSRRVDITTPQVQIVSFDEFQFGEIEPAIGVEITYVEGLSGSNVMLLKRIDVMKIVDLLMGTESNYDDFELNELSLSAICEVMNQMMGTSSTALSEFLGEVVNISTPVSFEVGSLDEFKEIYFKKDAPMVVVGFNLNIEGVVETRFLNLMSISLAKRLVSAFGLGDPLPDTDEPTPVPKAALIQEAKHSAEMAAAQAQAPEPSGGGKTMSQAEIEALLNQSAPAPAPAPEPSSGNKVMSQAEIEALLNQSAPAPAPTPAPAPVIQQPVQQPVQPQMSSVGTPDVMQQMMQMMQMMQQQMTMQSMQHNHSYEHQDPKMINVQPVSTVPLQHGAPLGEEQAENLAMIMSVPLEISVEIGRTKRLIKDILEFTTGSLVVLDKLAGEQVDIYVNGQCIAKGDVVVVDDNFGVRITEILKKSELKLALKS